MPMKSSATSSTLTDDFNTVVTEFLDRYKKVATAKNLVSKISDPQSLDSQVPLVTDFSLVRAQGHHN